MKLAVILTAERLVGINMRKIHCIFTYIGVIKYINIYFSLVSIIIYIINKCLFEKIRQCEK